MVCNEFLHSALVGAPDSVAAEHSNQVGQCQGDVLPLERSVTQALQRLRVLQQRFFLPKIRRSHGGLGHHLGALGSFAAPFLRPSLILEQTSVLCREGGWQSSSEAKPGTRMRDVVPEIWLPPPENKLQSCHETPELVGECAQAMFPCTKLC